MKTKNGFSLTGGIKKLKDDLAQMPTLRQKWDHIWTYYKQWLLVLALVIMGVSILVTSITNVNTDMLLAGITVNVDINDTGKAYVTDGLKEQLTKGKKLEDIALQQMRLHDLMDTEDFEEDYYSLQAILGMGAGKILDYLIMDKDAMEILLPNDPFMDLQNLLTPEELEALDSRVVYKEDTDGTLTPIAVEITDTPYIKDNATADGKVFLAFTVNTTRKDACRILWDHLNAWQPAQ